MNFNLGIKPFNDYWLNCNFNMIFSILTSFEPSYKLAAFMNDYSYEVSELETPTKTKFNSIILNPMINFSGEYLYSLFSQPQPINFKDDKNYVDFLKEQIRNKEFIMIGVDLFYWIPNSICWNINHWEHYSLINGFDDEKKVFYVMDENNSGFNEFEIPEERFLIAVQNSSLEPHGFINKVANNFIHFKFSIDDVIKNAKRLKEELTAIRFNLFWQLSEADFNEGHMSDLISMYIFQVINRHKANQILFKIIQDDMKNNEIFNSLIQYSKDLQGGWRYVRNKMIRTYFASDRKSSVIHVNEKCRNLFSKEYEMWDTFLSLIVK